jgi:cystathionine beta-lyase
MSDEQPDTKVVRAGRRAEWTQGIVSAPVWRASTILYDSVADLRASGGRDTHHRLFYGRRGTPTQWSLADALTELEPERRRRDRRCAALGPVAG